MKTQRNTTDLGCVIDKVRERERISGLAANTLRCVIVTITILAGFSMIYDREAIQVRVSEVLNPLPV
jgi:hypothetical protein